MGGRGVQQGQAMYSAGVAQQYGGSGVQQGQALHSGGGEDQPSMPMQKAWDSDRDTGGIHDKGTHTTCFRVVWIFRALKSTLQ